MRWEKHVDDAMRNENEMSRSILPVMAQAITRARGLMCLEPSDHSMHSHRDIDTF